MFRVPACPAGLDVDDMTVGTVIVGGIQGGIQAEGAKNTDVESRMRGDSLVRTTVVGKEEG